MPENDQAVCSACGAGLGNPGEEVRHPEDPDPPENAHFDVQVREDGKETAQCTETGQLASVIAGDAKIDPIEGKQTGTVGEGGGDSREQAQAESDGRSPGGEVYDLPEEKSQMDILKDVVSNPHFGLDDDQIQEMMSWASDFDGQMPPETLKDLASNMEGIKKQKANLLKQRYEIKLNKWISEQANSEQGPPIGGMHSQHSVNARSNGIRVPSDQTQKRKEPTPNKSQQNRNPQREEPRSNSPPGGDLDGYREKRKARRIKRRNDFADQLTEEMAKEMAPQLANTFAQDFGRLFRLPTLLLERKIEKDPDWAFEKAEELDVDLMSFLEPSDSRKEEMEREKERQKQAGVDHELDSALDNVKGGGGNNEPQQVQQQPAPPPSNQGEQTENIEEKVFDDVEQTQENAEGERPMTQVQENSVDDGPFNEIFGDEDVEGGE